MTRNWYNLKQISALNGDRLQLQIHVDRFRIKRSLSYLPVPVAQLVEYPPGSGGRRFESRPHKTKGVKMVPAATMLGAQHYKASTGFSSSNKYRTTSIASLTKKSAR